MIVVTIPLVGGSPIVEGRFLARPNRFLVEAELSSGQRIHAQCADRGRLVWLQPGMRLLLGEKDGAGRKTGHQVAAAWMNEAWASLDTHLPNHLVEAALKQSVLEPLTGYSRIQREVRHGASRFDFLLSDSDRRCYVEVKSVGVAHDGIGLFPDAPTERGCRHVGELAALAQAGTRTALVFIAQHAGATCVQPCREIDPAFADALQTARRAGVEVYAYCCPLTPAGIALGPSIPCVEL